MSGYRVHSFDPNAYEQPGPPMRPYNWVQWTGVGLIVFSLAGLGAYLAGRVGLLPEWIDSAFPLFMLAPLGSVLVNSRRQPATSVGPEQREKNRKVLIITIAICAVVLGAAAFIEFQGA
jgi:hypothetical protein